MPKSALTGSRIRERRLVLGLKQADLARKAGISASYLNLIEHNRRRIGGALLVRLAAALDTEPGSLSQGADTALLDALRSAAAGLDGRQIEVRPAEELAGSFPGWAALIATQAARIGRLEATVRTLNDRMTHDPFLSASLHDVLSTVTAIRSASSILADGQAVDPEWQARFHRNIYEDAERLTEASERLVGYLDAGGEDDPGMTAPQEELEAWLAEEDYYLAQLEGPMALEPGEVLARARGLSLSARALAERFLVRYAADARRLPAADFARALRDASLDPGPVAARFGVDLATVLRRMAFLPKDALPVPVGLAMCDASGSLSFRKPIEGFEMPRIGAACPLLPLYAALGHPMAPVRQVVTQGRQVPRRFDSFAVSQPTYPGGFGGPAVVEAVMAVLPAPASSDGRAIPVGTSCRICAQPDCAARREPSVVAETV